MSGAQPRRRQAPVTLLTYADDRFGDPSGRTFLAAQQRCLASGLAPGGCDAVVGVGPGSLDAEFTQRNAEHFKRPRGAGYFVWKPYVVRRQLEALADGEWLFWCDAGAYLIAPIDPLVAWAEREGRDVVVFDIDHLEREWTKRDAFVLLEADEPRFADTRQRLSGFFLLRRSPLALAVVDEWLAAAQDLRAITDDASVLGLPDHPGFTEHRHDQSLLSLITKKHGIPAARDPSEYGNRLADGYPECDYPQVVCCAFAFLPKTGLARLGAAARTALRLRTRLGLRG